MKIRIQCETWKKYQYYGIFTSLELHYKVFFKPFSTTGINMSWSVVMLVVKALTKGSYSTMIEEKRLYSYHLKNAQKGEYINAKKLIHLQFFFFAKYDLFKKV